MPVELRVTLAITPSDPSVPRRARLMLDPADPDGMLRDDGTAYDAREVALASTDGNIWIGTVILPDDSVENGFLVLMFSASPRSEYTVSVNADSQALFPPHTGEMSSWKERYQVILPAPR